jgi:hypothetical protein
MSIAFQARQLLAPLAHFVACLLLLTLAGSSAHAAGTVMAVTFEPPYAPGPLENNPGWVTAGSGSSSAIVQNAFAHPSSGSQAVLVTRSANSDRHWAVPQDRLNLPSQRFIAIDWDMRVSPATGGSGFGPFVGVDAYDANNSDSSIKLLGALGVDASTRDVLFQNPSLSETEFKVSYNEWYHYRILLDFSSHSYKGYVNGMEVVTSPFADGNLDDFTDADIAAFAAAPDTSSRALSANAVFDNFVIRDGLIGDYDIDGDVDATDAARWRSAFGTSVATPGNGADGNGNGVVDAADYIVWRENVGASLFSSSGSGLGSVVVPEPAGVLLALLVIIGSALLPARWR